MKRILIRRATSGEWLVVRPGYGFGGFTVTAYSTWTDAMRSVQFVSLGGAGSMERGSARGQGVSLW